MRITNPHQAYLDQRGFHDYDIFLETLHKCLKCGNLFDDSTDMSNVIDICKDCADPKAAAALIGGTTTLIAESASELKRHLKMGEQ